MIRILYKAFAVLWLLVSTVHSQSTDTTYLHWFSEEILNNPYHTGNGSESFYGNPKRIFQDHILSKIKRYDVPITLPEWETRKAFLLDTLRKAYRIDEYLSHNYELNVSYYDTIVRPHYKILKLTIESFPGIRVACLLYVPDSLSQPAPAIVYAEGAFVDPVPGEGHYGHYQWQEYATSMVQEGYIVLGVSLLGMGLDYFDGKNLQEPWGNLINFVGDDFRFRIWFAPALQALKYISTRSDVDTTRIGITGSSNGGAISYYLAMFDPRISSVVSVVGFPTDENFINKGFTVPQQSSESIFCVDEPATLLSLIAPKPHMLIVDEQDDFYNTSGVQPLVSKAQAVYDLYGASDKIKLISDNQGHNYNKTKREKSYGWFNRWLKGDSTVNIDSGIVEKKDTIFAWTPTETSVFNIPNFQSKTLVDILDSLKTANAPQFNIPLSPGDAIAELERQIATVISGLNIDTVDTAQTFSKLWENSDSVVKAEYFHLRADSLLYFPVVTLRRHDADFQKVVLLLFNKASGRGSWRNAARYQKHILGLLNDGYVIVSSDLIGCGELYDYDNYIYPNGAASFDEKVFARYENQFGKSIHGENAVAVRKLIRGLKQYYPMCGKIQILSDGPNVSIPAAVLAALEPDISLHVELSGLPSFKAILDNYSFGNYGTGVYSNGLYKLTDFPQLLTLAAPKPFAYYWIGNYNGNNASPAEMQAVSLWPQNIYNTLNSRNGTFTIINPTFDESDVYLPLKKWLQKFDGVNEPPIFVSISDTLAYADSLFSSELLFSDPDGDSLRYTKISGASWINIDSINGHMSGTPSVSDLGSNQIEIHVHDNHGGIANQVFNIFVSYTNHRPVIISLTDTLGKEDSLFTARIFARDEDSLLFGDQLRYQLLYGPNWLTIDSLTGTLSGIPTAESVGMFAVIIKVSDDKGGEDERSFNLHIIHTNHPPVIHTEFLPAAQEDSLYEYAVTATDTDSLLFGDVLHYSLSVSPVWLSIDSISGRLSGMPMAQNLGDTVVTILVKDGQGGEAMRTYVLHVAHTNHAPYWVTDPDTLAKENVAYHSRVLAGDVDSSLYGDYLRYRPLYGPGWLELDSISGFLSGTPPNNSDGDTVAKVTAADLTGTTIYKEWHIRVLPTNYSPSYVSTVYPLFYDTLTLFKIPIQRIFRWTSSVDPDNKDTVRYIFHLKGANLDTVIAGLSDTTLTLNGGLLAEQEYYRWYVDATDGEFIVTPPDTFTFQTTKRVANLTYTELPQTFKLFQNYPNPFNPSTTIRFQIPERSQVKIEVYNILGQFVQKIFEGNLDTKYYEVEWSPRSMASGIYIVRFSADGILSRKKYRSVKKLIYLK